jgi:hypothetical protein
MLNFFATLGSSVGWYREKDSMNNTMNFVAGEHESQDHGSEIALPISEFD